VRGFFFFCLAEELLASQEGLWSVESVVINVGNKCAEGLGRSGGQNGDVFMLNQAVHSVGNDI